jgi:glycosyltransferase involved in cell wall biosynthesis
MNKGAERATGDWVLFLNSGDLFFNNRVLSDCFSETIPASIDAVYGNTVYSYGKEGYREFRKAGELCHFWKGLMTCHQSFFVRRKVLERRKFDLRYKVAADFCSLYGLYMNGGLFLHIPVYVSLVDTTGISNNEKMVRSVREHWRVINQYHGNKLYYQVYYLLRFLWTVVLWGAKRIIPGIIYIQVIRLLRCEKDRKGPMDDFGEKMTREVIIIPAFNEEGSIGDLLDELAQDVPGIDVIVINDGSRDSTAMLAKRRHVTVLDIPCNLGVGGAVQAGFRFAYDRGYRYVIRIDGDGQHPPAEIPN